MLVLSRKMNEEIVIGPDIRITVVEIAPGRVKIGICAPRSVSVDRAEIHEKKIEEPTAIVQSVPHNRLNLLLPPEPTVAIAPALPNRIKHLRERFPKKPRV